MRLLFIIALLAQFSSFAQEKVTPNIITYVSPGDYYRVKVDDVLQPITNRFVIPPGPHKFTFWAPHHQAIDTQFVVLPLQQKLSFILKPTQTLVDYKRDMAAYMDWRGDKFTWYVSTFGSIGLAGVNYYLIGMQNIEHVKAQTSFKYNIPGYSPDERQNIEFWLRTSQVAQYVLYANIGFSGYMLYKTLKNKKTMPKLGEDKTFELANVGFFRDQFNNYQMGFMIKF